MATGIYGHAPRSPGRGHTIKQLRDLRESGYHNPDTRTELQPEEADRHLQVLEQRRSNSVEHAHVRRIMGTKTRSQGRPWIPAGEVVFRNINGHVVPFRKTNDPWL